MIKIDLSINLLSQPVKGHIVGLLTDYQAKCSPVIKLYLGINTSVFKYSNTQADINSIPFSH